MKENSKIKNVFQENSYPEIRKKINVLFSCKMGGGGGELVHGINLYTDKYGKVCPLK